MTLNAEPPTQPFRNRITGHGTMRAGDFLANPDNYRIHPTRQREAVTDVLDQIGWVKPVLVNELTGFCIDGHLRVSIALSEGESTAVPVSYVQLSPQEEAAIIAFLDSSTGLAVTDTEQLDGLLDKAAGLLTSDGPAQKMLSSLLAKAKEKPEAGQEEATEGKEEADPAERPMRAVTLHITPEAAERLEAQVKYLAGCWGLLNATETILQAVSYAYDAEGDGST